MKLLEVEQIQASKNLTKKQRINLVLETLVNKMPPTVQLMTGAYRSLAMQSLEDAPEEKIDSVLTEVREILDFVEYGD